MRNRKKKFPPHSSKLWSYSVEERNETLRCLLRFGIRNYQNSWEHIWFLIVSIIFRHLSFFGKTEKKTIAHRTAPIYGLASLKKMNDYLLYIALAKSSINSMHYVTFFNKLIICISTKVNIHCTSYSLTIVFLVWKKWDESL